jgi:signal transduction histidine kinase
MPEDVRRRAAEPFFTSKPSGSGLGLAVVQRVVTEAGGSMAIDSEPGRGTRVALSFPSGNA